MQSFTIVIQLNEAGAAAGRFEPRIFQEGLYMRATQGALSGLTRNPIRARPELVINWHLPKEGQSQYQKHYFILDPVFSLREDMPPDPSIESHRAQPNDKFISAYRPESAPRSKSSTRCSKDRASYFGSVHAITHLPPCKTRPH